MAVTPERRDGFRASMLVGGGTRYASEEPALGGRWHDEAGGIEHAAAARVDQPDDASVLLQQPDHLPPVGRQLRDHHDEVLGLRIEAVHRLVAPRQVDDGVDRAGLRRHFAQTLFDPRSRRHLEERAAEPAARTQHRQHLDARTGRLARRAERLRRLEAAGLHSVVDGGEQAGAIVLL